MLPAILLAAGVGFVFWRLSQHKGPLLDAHLPGDTENAVIFAAAHEKNPSKLRAFARSLLPHFPAAASTLFARAARAEQPVAAGGIQGLFTYGVPGAQGGDLFTYTTPDAQYEGLFSYASSSGATAIEFANGDAGGFSNSDAAGGFDLFKSLKTMASDAAKIGPLAFVPGAGAAVILATGLAAAGHTKEGKKIGTDLSKSKVLSTIAQGYQSGYMQANPAYFARTLIAGAADESLHGQRLDRAILDQRHAVSKWLGDKAKYAGSAAGVPPTVTPALTAAANVAEGKPIPANVVQAASGVVGQAVGPVASQALEQGAQYGDQLTNGATSQALAAVAQARSAVPPQAVHAFDTGVALTVARGLQQRGYAAAHNLLPDQHPAGKVVFALNAPTGDLLTAAIQSVQQKLPLGAANTVHHVVAMIVAQPELGRLSPHDLALRLRVSEPVARVALASVSHEVPGAPVVHAQRLQAVVGKPAPPTGRSSQVAAWTQHYNQSAE